MIRVFEKMNFDITSLGRDSTTILEYFSNDKKFLKLDKHNFNYVVENYDLDKKIAYIKVYISGEMAISEKSRILDKSKFVGMSFTELENYLKKGP